MRPGSARRPKEIGVRLAALLAALLLSTGLVVRLSATLDSRSPASREALSDGGASLHLSAGADAPLFDAVLLQPGNGVSACTRISVRGPDDPSPLQWSISRMGGDPALAAATHVTVEHVEAGAADDSCESFASIALLAEGTWAQLSDRHGGGGSPLETVDLPSGEAEVWFRLTATLDAAADTDVAGAVIDDLDLRWTSSVVPPSQGDVLERISLLLGAVAEHSVVPLLIMLAIAVLFLGIQDRIDRRDPKLAAAPVLRGVVEFESRGT